MKYRVIETEAFYPEYRYTEVYDDLKPAQARMKGLYRELVIEGNYEAIDHSEYHPMSAWVKLNDGNEIAWDIEEIEED